MKLLFLGTGAGVPSKGRNVSAIALKLLDERNEVWLFDCGEATQHQILHTSLKPRKITKIFITHLHGDHIFGLPGFLSSRSFQGGDDRLEIYGPAGIKTYIETSLKITGTHLHYPLIITELKAGGGELEFEGGWQIDYLPLDHGILSFGYRITEPDQPGQLLMDRLADYQIPNGPILGQLKRGEQVQLPNGQVLDGRDFIAPARKGRVVAIMGDTRPHPNTIWLAQDANALVHEATVEAAEARMAHAHHHTTSQQVGQLAQKAQVKDLYMTHISARYLGKDAKKLENEAAKEFVNSHVVYDFNEFEVK